MTKRNATTLSLFQLTEMFPTVDSAMQYFERVRWNGNPTCTKCEKADKITPQKEGRHILVRNVSGVLYRLHEHTLGTEQD